MQQAACTLEELRDFNRSRTYLEGGERVRVRGTLTVGGHEVYGYERNARELLEFMGKE